MLAGSERELTSAGAAVGRSNLPLLMLTALATQAPVQASMRRDDIPEQAVAMEENYWQGSGRCIGASPVYASLSRSLVLYVHRSS